MAFEASTMLELLVSITWNCLAVPVYKNPLFLQILCTRELLSEFITATPFSFCPGLFEAIQAPLPPTISWLKNLPGAVPNIWGIYALVLEMDCVHSLVYVGSGTSAHNGLRSRLYQYDTLQSLPINVEEAIAQGYEIVHKGVLVWCPRPSPTDVPRQRVLFIAIECALSFLFWAMKSKIKDYGMSVCCPWDRSLFTYDGLCSHSALMDGVIKGNFGLSTEQIEEMAAASRDQIRRNHASSEVNIKASKKYSCELCGVSCKSAWELQRHDGSRQHLEKLDRERRAEPPKKKSYSAKSQAKAVAAKKYFCDTCDVSCPSQWELTRHNGSKRHLKKVAAAKSSSVST
jgi:hypothetical protein